MQMLVAYFRVELVLELSPTAVFRVRMDDSGCHGQLDCTISAARHCLAVWQRRESVEYLHDSSTVPHVQGSS